ncbi:hypothetical protein [Streptomyces ficellus]|uniref:Uncharacterized protein n=1 Tax=Streptomyces ficellus TaxID=1977088 RepID=A0A6I6FDS5_9ACTN|nr:hypothetical protein [Streptomyces ficellus]QGV82153.1 hypothetical protein EIZ62_30780 [Streptomyces ficellus]
MAQCSWKKAADFHIQGHYARSLCVTYSPNSGPLVLGSTLSDAGGSDFLVLVPRLPDTSGSGQPWVLRASPLFAPGMPVVGGGFLPYYPATGQKNVYVYYFLEGKRLLRYEEWGGQYQGPYEVSTTVDQFCGTYYVPNLNQDNPQGDVGFAYLEGQHLVTGSYMTPGHHLILDPVMGAGFTAQARAQVWQDANGLLHVFGTSSNQGQTAGNLQVLHQRSWQTREAGLGPDTARVVQPAWTSANVAAAPVGIGGYDLARPQDRLVAFDYTGQGSSDHLLAYRPGEKVVWVIKRTPEPGGFTHAYQSAAGLPDYDFASYADQAVAYDYTGSGSARYVLAYRPGAGKFAILQKNPGAEGFTAAVSVTSGGIGEPGRKYDLASTADRLVPFDYSGSGKNTHLLAYRPGTGTAWVLAPNGDGTFHPVVTSSTGLGGFNLNNPSDIVIGLDYGSTGSNTHLLAYRPGTGIVYIVQPDKSGGFTTVMKSDGKGIGDYDLIRPNDRLVPFDYTGLGKNDHIIAYRPGDVTKYGDQTVWILKRDDAAPTRYAPAVQSRYGIGGYDFTSSADTVSPYDYSGTGSSQYLVAYRPGSRKVSVMGQRGGRMAPVYQAPPGPSTLVTVGLHADIIGFQLDPYPDFKPSELIKMSGMSAAEAYCLCTQDITTSQWQTDKVRVPPPKEEEAPFIVSHYVAEATLLSKQGSPMEAHSVSVSADSLVEVQIDEVSYQVGPGRTIAVMTNQSGKLVISIAARGLNPPVVHLNADGLREGAAIDFAAKANSFLAGEGTLPSQKGTFTPELLKDAKAVPNDPSVKLEDAPPLANWDALEERGLTPKVVVDHCSNMYAQAAGGEELKLTFDGRTAEPVVGYVIQLWDEDRPAFQAFRSQEELEAYRAYRNNHPSYGGWWDDFTSWASDVWEGIKTGATRVAEVIVSTVVEIAIWIGDAVVSLGEMIIEAIEQAIQAVEAVFQMIADAIMRVIDWLKSLFALDDIWDTKEALETIFLSTSTKMTACLTSVAGLTEDWFEAQKEKINHTFDEMINRYEGARMGDFGNKVDPAPSPTGGDLEQKDMSSPQGTWFLNKTLGAPAATDAQPFSLVDPPLVSELDTLVQKLTSSASFGTLVDFSATLQNFVESFVSNSDDQTGRSTYASLLDGVRNFIIKALDAAHDVVQALLEFAEAGVAKLTDLVKYPISLPLVDTLYEWVQTVAYPLRKPEPLTIGGFVFLVAGFFVTTIHKLIFGVDNPPFPKEQFTTLDGPMEEPDPPPEHPGDPVKNQHMVGLQATGVPWAFLQAFGVGLTDIMEPILLKNNSMGEGISKLINASVAIINGYQGLVLGSPEIMGAKQWSDLSKGAYALSIANFFGDIVLALGGDKMDKELAYPRSTLTKNLGTTWLEKADNITVGSLLQTAIGIASMVVQCVDLAAGPPNTDASKAAAWVNAACGHTHNIFQIVRMIALRFVKNEAWRKGLYIGATVADAAVIATGDLAVGVPACIALDHAPRITNGGETREKEVLVPAGTKDTPYTDTFTVEGAGADVPLNSPLNYWEIVDGPPGLQITPKPDDATKATFTGTPTVQGTYHFTVRVWDTFTPKLCSYSGPIERVLRVRTKPYFTITINPGP